MVARFSKSLPILQTTPVLRKRACSRPESFSETARRSTKLNCRSFLRHKLPSKAATESDKETTRRVEPIEWLKTGDLVLESQMLNEAWGRAASKITIGFDAENRASIRNVNRKRFRSSITFCCCRRIASKAHRRFGCGTRKLAAIFIFARPNRVKRISMKKMAI